MAKFGVQISQDGTPIRDAADFQDVTDDRWQYMEVIWEDDYVADIGVIAGGSTEARVIYKHNLGYIPAFTSVRLEKTSTGSNFGSVVVIADSTNIYAWCNIADSAFASGTIHYKFRIRVFELNIERTFKETISDVSASPGTTPKYEFKALKDGKNDMASTNLNDYTVDTIGKSLTVHATGIATVPDFDIGLHPEGGSFSVQHDLGYPPIFFITQYMRDANYTGGDDILGGRPRVYSLGQLLRVYANDPNKLTFYGGQSGLPANTEWAYVILKDPLQEKL